MNIVFADTGFWIALLNPRDSLHDLAIELDASGQFDHVVTTEMVLAEFLNDFGSRGMPRGFSPGDGTEHRLRCHDCSTNK